MPSVHSVTADLPRPGGGRGQRSDDMRRRNLSTVLRHILTHPGSSRSEIARASGMSAATVTNLSAGLLRLGLVRELTPEVQPRGRPRVPLSPEGATCLTLGIHLGPRVAGVALVNLLGEQVDADLVEHTGLGVRATLNRVVKRATRMITENASTTTILGTGIATGGVVDRSRGVVVDHPAAGWRNAPVVDLVGDRLPGPVILEQNVRASAQSELLYGHGREVDDFVILLVTSDTGAVIVHDRRIQPGSRQAAGHLAHLRVADEPVPCSCGLHGCLQAVATDDAVLAAARAGALPEAAHTAELIDLYRANEPRAVALFEQRARHTAHAAATLINIVDPSLLVIMGTVAEMPELLPLLREEVAVHAFGGDDAGARVVLAPEQTFSLTLSAAAPVIEAALADPMALLPRHPLT